MTPRGQLEKTLEALEKSRAATHEVTVRRAPGQPSRYHCEGKEDGLDLAIALLKQELDCSPAFAEWQPYNQKSEQLRLEVD